MADTTLSVSLNRSAGDLVPIQFDQPLEKWIFLACRHLGMAASGPQNRGEVKKLYLHLLAIAQPTSDEEGKLRDRIRTSVQKVFEQDLPNLPAPGVIYLAMEKSERGAMHTVLNDIEALARMCPQLIQMEKDQQKLRTLDSLFRAMNRGMPVEIETYAQGVAWLQDLAHASELAKITNLCFSNPCGWRIPDCLFELPLPNLQTLSLVECFFGRLPEELDTHWPQLRTLYLGNNALRTLPPNFGSHWVHLEKLYVGDNPHLQLSSDLGIPKSCCIILDAEQVKGLPADFPFRCSVPEPPARRVRRANGMLEEPGDFQALP